MRVVEIQKDGSHQARNVSKFTGNVFTHQGRTFRWRFTTPGHKPIGVFEVVKDFDPDSCVCLPLPPPCGNYILQAPLMLTLYDPTEDHFKEITLDTLAPVWSTWRSSYPTSQEQETTRQLSVSVDGSGNPRCRSKVVKASKVPEPEEEEDEEEEEEEEEVLEEEAPEDELSDSGGDDEDEEEEEDETL